MRRPGRFARPIVQELANAADAFATADVRASGILGRLDPRMKLACFGLLLLAAVFTPSRLALFVLAATCIASAVVFRVPVRNLFPAGAALTVTFLLALPAVFLTPGPPGSLPGSTVTGIVAASRLLLRALCAGALSSVLILTTPWPHVLKALRAFRVPVAVIAVLGMTCRYVFLLLQVAMDLFEARESRRVGHLSRQQQRALVASGAGVLLARALTLSEDVYLAMRSRGYHGEVYLLTNFRMAGRDWLFGTGCASLAAILLFAIR